VKFDSEKRRRDGVETQRKALRNSLIHSPVKKRVQGKSYMYYFKQMDNLIYIPWTNSF